MVLCAPDGDPSTLNRSAWTQGASALAAWADKHLVNRRDAFGGYYRKDGKTHTTTRKAADQGGPLTLRTLQRHFRATGTDALVGLHSTARDEAGESWSRWLGIDIDRHDNGGDPEANLRFALALFDRAVALGFTPLLFDSNGRGGYHLWLLFDGPVATHLVFAFARWLISDWESHGFSKQPETFPKQPGIAEGGFGNWMRLPGRHHSRDHHTRVWDGSLWLEGTAAIKAIVTTVGTPEERIPAEARPDPNAPFDLGREIERKREQATHAEPGHSHKRRRETADDGTTEPGTDFNARADWQAILGPHGWVLDHESEGTRFWRRPGKDAGHSATTNHNGNNTLYVFTDATVFAKDGSYSPYGAYTVLSHGGDFKAAARTLSQQGYGTFLAWVWHEEAGEWRMQPHQNPCPKGGLVRIARQGEGPPPPPRGSKGKSKATAEPSANGDGHQAGDDGAGAGPFVGPETSRTVAGSAEGAPGLDLDLGLGKRPRTDLGNAERLVARHGRDLRYCHPWGKWLVWDGRRWSLDQTGAARRRARNTARALGREAAAQGNGKRRKALLQWALTSEKRDKLSALLHLAEAEEGIPILPEDLNSDPWVFNVWNGTIDLRTGESRPHRRDDLITQLCPIDHDPDAPCPLWLETLGLFLHRDDPRAQAELIGYFQRLCGYAMVGVVRDHVLPVAFGTGSNGKSTILGTLMDVFGPDYALKCPPDLLMAKKTDSHPTDRADLFGRRLVVAIETEAGRRLNETMVKELTGGDRIRARRMREDFWEFQPTHTLFMATNHKPVIRGTDHGIWRRLKLVPFTVSLGDDRADKSMPEKLRTEHAGILAWCVRGCIEWRMRGLDAPAEVTKATSGYRREQDLLGAFLDECTVSGPSYRAKASALYARYKAWGEAGSEFVATQTAFSLALQERGFEKTRSGGSWYLGIGLVDSNASRTEESKPEAGDDPPF